MMKLQALTQIKSLDDLAVNHKHSFEARAMMLVLIGIIYALIYIGYCIKEIKNAK